MMIARQVFTATPIEESQDSLQRSNEGRMALIMAKRQFFASFSGLKDDWGDLEWMDSFLRSLPEDKRQLLHGFSMQKESLTYGQQEWLQSQLDPFLKAKDYLAISKNLLERSIRRMKGLKKYEFINFEHPENFFGDAREVFFAKVISENYCAAARKSKVLWVHVGKGHAAGLKCYLTHLLPDHAKITIRTPEDYSDRYARWQDNFAKNVEPKIRQLVRQAERNADFEIIYNQSQLGTGSTGTWPTGEIWVIYRSENGGLKGPLSRVFPSLKKVIEASGAQILDRRNFSKMGDFRIVLPPADTVQVKRKVPLPKHLVPVAPPL